MTPECVTRALENKKRGIREGARGVQGGQVTVGDGFYDDDKHVYNKERTWK